MDNKKIVDYALNKFYNVEYQMGNGKWNTFSNVLIGSDSLHLHFYNEESGQFDLVRTDRIVNMNTIPNGRYTLRV